MEEGLLNGKKSEKTRDKNIFPDTVYYFNSLNHRLNTQIIVRHH